MSQWGNRDLANNAPRQPIFGGLGVNANGEALFGNTTIGLYVSNALLSVEGVTTAEKSGNNAPAHAGWVATKRGTGPVIGINILSGGRYNAAGNIAFSGGNGSGAVATFGIGFANTLLSGTANVVNGSVVVVGSGTDFANNLVANVDYITVNNQVRLVANVTSATNVQVSSAFTTNATGASVTRTTNTITSVTVVAGGSGFLTAPTVTANAANLGSAASLVAVLGGRGGRTQSETLVAMGSIT